MEKLKSRWRKNYLEGDTSSYDGNNDLHNTTSNTSDNNTKNKHHHHHNHRHHSSSKHTTPPIYEPLVENLYLDKRKNEHARNRKDARYMVCDCILTKEERARGVMGCLDDCLNRMLMIECGPKCTLGDHCLNKRFQKFQSSKVEVFKTRKKGWGLRAITDLSAQSFIMEYVGEVVRLKEFRSRVKKYTKQKIKHHYFMALNSDEIIDATMKGNLTRFINHSCEPNCETQKWTVNGEVRIGFFTIRNLQAGEEITFDYQFQRYGRKAQKCYCEAPSCRGFIGGNEQTFSLNGNSTSPQPNENSKTHKKPYKHGLLLDVTLEDKINALAEAAAQGLKTKDQVIALASLSIKAEKIGDRRKILEIIKITKSEISLRLFVDYHGLEIICLWMRDPQADCDFKATIIDILEKLPIPNKTKVVESNVYRMIERWATEEPKTNNTPPALETNANSNDATPTKRRRNDDKEQGITQMLETGNALKAAVGSQASLQPQTPTKETPSLNNASNNTLLPVQSVKTPQIKALASKLLKKFQALSPGFKIPRLSRLQRMEIEKKMEEETIVAEQTGNEKSVFEQKNPFATRNYFKSTTTTAPTTTTLNGLVNSTSALKTNTFTNKRRFDSLATNNIDLTPAPKISKEEHRQQFEMSVRLKDYYDTVKKHYGVAAAEQLKLNHIETLTTNNIDLTPTIFNATANLTPQRHPATVAAHPTLTQPPQPFQRIPIVSATPPTSLQPHPPPASLQPHAPPPNLLVSHQHHQQQQHQQQQIAIQQQYANLLSQQLQLHLQNYQQQYQHHQLNSHQRQRPTLIVLANNSIEEAHTIDDELAFSICNYDKYYTDRDKPVTIQDLQQDSYPCPGTYYTTPNGETWFASVTLDRNTQQPRTVIAKIV